MYEDLWYLDEYARVKNSPILVHYSLFITDKSGLDVLSATEGLSAQMKLPPQSAQI